MYIYGDRKDASPNESSDELAYCQTYEEIRLFLDCIDFSKYDCISICDDHGIITKWIKNNRVKYTKRLTKI